MRRVLIVGVVLLLGLTSCRKNDVNEVFDFVQRVNFTIDPGLNTIDTYFFPFDPIASGFKTRLDDFGLTIDDISHIQPKVAELSSLFGDEDLEFIRKVIIRVHEPGKPVTTGMEIFNFDPAPLKKSTVLRPFPNLGDAKEFMEESFYGLEVRLDFRYVTTRAIDMKLEFKMSATR